MPFVDGIITAIILLGIFFMVYSRIKNQDLRDTYEEMKDLIMPMEMELPV